MTELSTANLYRKLEIDGVDVVKRKLQENLYQSWKQPLIEKWLVEKSRLERLGIEKIPDATAGGQTPVGAVFNEDYSDVAPTALFEQYDDKELDALAEDADREMIGDDVGLVDDIGNK